MGRYVVGSLAVIRALGEPALDRLAVGGCVVVVTTLEAEPAHKQANQSINFNCQPINLPACASLNTSIIVTLKDQLLISKLLN